MSDLETLKQKVNSLFAEAITELDPDEWLSEVQELLDSTEEGNEDDD